MVSVPARGPGHCEDDGAWAAFVRQYDGQPRSLPDMTDFALANAVFMADRNDLNLMHYQTAAKERIRWLSIELAKAQGALAAAPVREEGGAVEWHRLGDALPEYGRPLLIAYMREGEDFWRVRDAHLHRRHEGVFAALDHLKDGEFAKNWWFDSIYPGKGDLRLAHEDLLWAYMPTPAATREEAPTEAGE